MMMPGHTKYCAEGLSSDMKKRAQYSMDYETRTYMQIGQIQLLQLGSSHPEGEAAHHKSFSHKLGLNSAIYSYISTWGFPKPGLILTQLLFRFGSR